MKLIDRIMGRMAATLVVVISLWTLVFYFALVDEIVDEVDDALELYSESVMMRFLAGEPMADKEIGTNNSYSIIPLTELVAATQAPHIFTNETIWIEEKNETEPARVLSMTFRDAGGKPFLLRVSTPTFDVLELQRAILMGTLVLYVILLLTILCVNYVVIQRNMRPLYALLRWMDDYDLHHHNKPFVSTTEVTEFRRLNEASNRQVKRLSELYERQRDFVDHAAHEMQTPLAVALNRLEELQQRTDLSEEAMGEVAAVRQPLSRLVRLHRDMLQLSRIENGAYSGSVPVALDELIRSRVADFTEIYSYKDLKCELYASPAVVLQMNETLAEILFGNLLRNAWLHTPQGGTITIGWDADKFVVSNSGEHALDSEHIFERFYREGNKNSSNGLGLAICRSVCLQYGFGLAYRFRGGEHCFEVHYGMKKSVEI